MEFARWLEVASGTLLVLLTIYDVFKSVVLPRPAINKFVFVRQLFLASWRLWKWISERLNPVRREGWLATFGPVLAIIMFAVWALLFIIGYGLMIDGLREEMRPVPGDFWESIYFSRSATATLCRRGCWRGWPLSPRARQELESPRSPSPCFSLSTNRSNVARSWS